MTEVQPGPGAGLPGGGPLRLEGHSIQSLRLGPESEPGFEANRRGTSNEISAAPAGSEAPVNGDSGHNLDTLAPTTTTDGAVDSAKDPAAAMEPRAGATLEPGFVDTSSGQRPVVRYEGGDGRRYMKFVAPPPPTGPPQL